MMILDGKAAALKIRARLREEVENLRPLLGREPGLAVILAGDDPSSRIYVRNKRQACAEAGCRSLLYELPASLGQAEMERLVDELNAREEVDGILIQLPLPPGLDSLKLLERIAPSKDVDGFHPQNMGRLALGLPGLRPCTPAGVMELLRLHGLSPQGKKAVVVGRSNIVGKPLALMLEADGPQGNATVTLCHSHTPDIKKECLRADFIFLALGRPQWLKADMVKEGAVVVDIGITRTDLGLKGDCDFDALLPKVRAITPVPGGIGPMTIAMLLRNTLQACILRAGGAP
ncbi:MAG: bifunctional methylenetetrahydrofolate dehydrogenase/methenyltetrahydrofolate cyclohydrolase FolD [Deltaproteobacteria bacterium]|jgi:methylenetetrahydrofolate dehydrogenase (NADP+)/methenyltetrahydrofolate cyclohydrolase|nr:bifunctional methylenetetrahydrofolate dehydrogenase/methenyltetrahydrofolate cyclohydrolase FolD [Deltaproteobacteria bacterium]